jgi:hypothetical protein
MDNLRKPINGEFVRGMMLGAMAGLFVAAYTYSIADRRPKLLDRNPRVIKL